MATQTLIQLKYSTANSVPSTLEVSEPAYSFVSEKLFIGNDVNNPIAVGGQFYTRLLEANTFYAIPNTIVTRDVTGNTNFNSVQANTLFSNTTIFAGQAAGGPLEGATNPIIGATGNANNYIQAYIRNLNSGSEASADYAAYSDVGSDVSGWIDMGITSSTYNSELYTLTGPEEGYILMSATNGSGFSGNLVIATDSTGTHNDIIFQTGGFTGALHPLMTLRDGYGLDIQTGTAASSNSTGALVVQGGVGVQGTIYADNVVISGQGGGVITSVTPSARFGIAIDSLTTTNGAVTFGVRNTGVGTLTANSGQLITNTSTGNVEVGLATTTVSSGVYGGSTQIPTFTVDQFGRLSQAANVAITSSFTLSGNTGTDTFSTGDTLFIKGDNTGIVTTVTDNTISIATDTTVLRSNTTTAGNQTIQTDLTITGNLVVRGDQIVANTIIVETDDSLIKLAANNTTDALDIGFFGQYDDSGLKYAGLFRKASDIFYLFDGVTTDPISNTVTFDSSNRGTLDTNITGGTISSLDSAIAIADGGTNSNTFSTGQITYFDGTSIVSLANTGTSGTYGNTSHVPVITTDDYGRVSGVTNTAIAIDASAVTSGILGVTNGGTGSSSFTIKGVVVSDESSTTGALTALTGSAYQVLQLNSTGVPVFGGLNGGTF